MIIQDVPFEKFHQVLGFLASIGLATVVSGAFSLTAAQSILGDTSVTALSAAKDSAILLCWASACFILALVFIVGTQLLYTDPTIRANLKNREGLAVYNRIARVIIAVFACLPLGLQVAAMFLLGQSLGLLSGGPMMMARYGIVGGLCILLVTALIIIVPDSEARNRYFRFLSKVSFILQCSDTDLTPFLELKDALDHRWTCRLVMIHVTLLLFLKGGSFVIVQVTQTEVARRVSTVY